MNKRCAKWIGSALLVVALGMRPARAADHGVTDSITLGDSASEQAHGLKTDHSEVVPNGLHESARQLLPLSPLSFDGGWISFTVKVDPAQQNYVTAKLWGSDKGAERGRLILYANGLQVGYRHEGDYDVLNQCDEEAEAPGRFLYQTLPLPMNLTRGQQNVTLKIAALGPMWPYGANFTQYQKNFTEPSRGIYGVYIHTAARFEPEPSEKQGTTPDATVRPAPGEEVIGKTKQTVIARLTGMLKSPSAQVNASHQKDRAARLLLMSEAYNVPWTPAYHNTQALQQITRDGDSMADDFASDSQYAAKDWPGAGPLGEAILRTWPAIGKALDEPLSLNDTTLPRRQAWTHALRQSVDYWRTHRRDYTNQSMIVDRNIYTANRALQLIAPKEALPEEKARQYLYQAVGLDPWLGSDPRTDSAAVADAPGKGMPKPYGDHYSLVTKKGLTRELGWVATYGETILHFTHDIAQLTGDERIRHQLAKLQAARMFFRYPGVDADGFRCMKLASEVDNRTAHYPLAGSAYTAPNIREEWWMDLPAMLSDDPISVGAAQQALEDNQYFAYVASRENDADTLGMMRNVDEYAAVKALPPSTYRLPMTDGQPDFVFADEQDAIVALKHGQTRLFVNFYYRAERGVNNAARLLEITPTITRIATVRTRTHVESSGQEYTRPDWIDAIRGKGFPPPGQQIHQAWAGEKLPISMRPPDAKLPAYGDWGPFLGKAAAYELTYGPYLILMNSSESQNYVASLPSRTKWLDLVTNKPVDASTPSLTLPPLTTAVLYPAP